MKSLLRNALLLITLLLLTLTSQAQTATPEPIIAKWDGQSPFTVLVAGLDRRPGAGDTLNVRTDAIMLVRFDPAAETIGILHIPRDLFFALPPTETGEVLPLVRVNTLMLRGEGTQAGYGPYYMMDIIQYNFGMYIDAYVLFDFDAFMTVVDAIGGIDITTTYDIYDASYPDMGIGYDPFYLPAGDHHLDGADALKFARTRHGDNDYLRGVRQLQVIRAIGERATSPEILPTLLIQAPDLLQALEGEVYTDLTVNDAVALGSYAARLPLDQIKTGALNQAYITHTVNEGESVAIPDREKLTELLTEVFGTGYNG
jgi:LCP family protein required for cell wall assembly